MVSSLFLCPDYCTIWFGCKFRWSSIPWDFLEAEEKRMPATLHVEKHFTASAAVRDIVIGMSDGLTVPFALAAGLTGAVMVAAQGNSIIVTAGLAEIAAGSIAMGLGGYLAAKTDSEHYA
jgi:hypothetical protein